MSTGCFWYILHNLYREFLVHNKVYRVYRVILVCTIVYMVFLVHNDVYRVFLVCNDVYRVFLLICNIDLHVSAISNIVTFIMCVLQACFTVLLGPFVFFNVQKTKYLQMLTTVLRWLGKDNP